MAERSKIVGIGIAVLVGVLFLLSLRACSSLRSSGSPAQGIGSDAEESGDLVMPCRPDRDSGLCYPQEKHIRSRMTYADLLRVLQDMQAERRDSLTSSTSSSTANFGTTMPLDQFDAQSLPAEDDMEPWRETDAPGAGRRYTGSDTENVSIVDGDFSSSGGGRSSAGSRSSSTRSSSSFPNLSSRSFSSYSSRSFSSRSFSSRSFSSRSIGGTTGGGNQGTVVIVGGPSGGYGGSGGGFGGSGGGYGGSGGGFGGSGGGGAGGAGGFGGSGGGGFGGGGGFFGGAGGGGGGGGVSFGGGGGLQGSLGEGSAGFAGRCNRAQSMLSIFDLGEMTTGREGWTFGTLINGDCPITAAMLKGPDSGGGFGGTMNDF